METTFLKAIVFIMVLSFLSCTKEDLLDQNSIDLADDDAVSEAVFNDIFNSVDNADIIMEGLLKDGDTKSEIVLSDSCPVITISRPEGALWPKTTTIDFGEGCEGLYNNSRSGKMIITVSGPRVEKGSTRTVTFDNYYFNRIRVEGTKVIENLGFNSTQHLTCSVKLINGKLTLPDGKTISRSFEHQREWVAGLLTRNIWDDECLITGTTTGININGVAYTNTIRTALYWKRVCRFFVSGVVLIERAGLEPVEIDYGSGECDAVATVTRGDDSKEIILKFRHRGMGNN